MLGEILARPFRPADTVSGTTEVDARLARSVDLIVFPEAFLARNDLISTIEMLQPQGPFGCVHVGLRPNDDAEASHLFTPGDIQALVQDIANLPFVVPEDLAAFRVWLSRQHAADRFNLSCFFSLDTDGRMRIALQVKNLASPLEENFLPEGNVTEGDFLTLITLKPEDKALRTVVVQPIICSDCLLLQTRVAGPSPVQAVTSAAERFGDDPPDAVDLVSAVTCTPQLTHEAQGLTWQWRFRRTFEQASLDAAFGRHNQAFFVLSNVRMYGASPAGLSGYFGPIEIDQEQTLGAGLVGWTWGVAHGGDLSWLRIGAAGDANLPRKVRGHLICVDSAVDPGDAAARVFDLTINHFPRHRMASHPSRTMIDCAVTDLPAILNVNAGFTDTPDDT